MKNPNEALNVVDAISELSRFEWAVVRAAKQIEEFREQGLADIAAIKQLAEDLQELVNYQFVTRNSEVMEVINSLGN